MIAVVAGVMRVNGRLLLTRRIRGGDVGMWEFPGGKLEAGETPEQALCRELNEEMGIAVQVGRVLDVVADWQGADGSGLLLMFYECEIVCGEPRSIDNGGVRIASLDELGTIPLAHNDRVFARRYFAV